MQMDIKDQAPISQMIYETIIKDAENLFCFNFDNTYSIRSQFCTCHASSAAMAHANCVTALDNYLHDEPNLYFYKICFASSQIICKIGATYHFNWLLTPDPNTFSAHARVQHQVL